MRVIVSIKNLDSPTNIRQPRKDRFHAIVATKIVSPLKDKTEMYDLADVDLMDEKNREEVKRT